MQDITMKELMDELSRLINEKYTLRKFSKISGVSRKSITRALKCENKYEMKLDSFLKVVQVLFENYEIRRRKINSFVLLVNSPLNIRKALCYAHVSGEYELIDKLVERHNNNESINQYLTVYDLFNQRNKNKLKGEKIIEEIKKSKISSDPECQVVLNLLYMVAMYDEDDSNAVAPFAKEVERLINNVEQKYIKDCLYMQYKERIAYKYLSSDELDECRKICNSILNSEMEIPMIKAVAQGCLGESYLYENPLLAETHIECALKFLENINVPRKSQKFFAFKTTLAHLYIENNFNIHKIDFDYLHDGESAHYECLYGDREKGLAKYAILEQNGFSAHQLYSYSKVIGDMEGLRKALIKFERSGNLFYARGVKKALMKDEVNLVE
ncbi:prophage helix-turn-helix protein [Bacillus thuringiensis]|uniref:AimR family lysis-lysogeny pheromone receptor n=1 Tax=Bacillus cereus group TaxID=86661 RepID=UPI000A39189D|nr:AimR family lysis-lysogeny pheromone receptor [Bacillus thuringiensis]MBG9530798.1 prophage helix-turn-helix protein [Bacillus thuringiensis]OUB18699.1 hypothetical protein BK708_21025 [Bacillus thuringiensis serovar yunnanensis]